MDELGAVERGNACSRYEGQAPTVILSTRLGWLRATLEWDTARDLLGTLTSRDVYQILRQKVEIESVEAATRLPKARSPR